MGASSGPSERDRRLSDEVGLPASRSWSRRDSGRHPCRGEAQDARDGARALMRPASQVATSRRWPSPTVVR